MATTLERASFAGQIGSQIVLKLVDATGIAVGASIPIGSSGTGVVTQILPYNSVRVRITAGPTSGALLIPRGTAAG